jgi:SAM-dependent methyltransferase
LRTSADRTLISNCSQALIGLRKAIGEALVMSIRLLIVRLVYWFKGLLEDPEELFNSLGVAENDTILEIGCAIGYHTFPLAEIAVNGRVYAVDIWEEGLEHIRRKMGAKRNIELLCRSAETVEFAPALLDKVVCFDTLHDLTNPEQAVNRWTESLKEGGELLFRDPEISPERISTFSGGQLHPVRTVEGVYVLARL